MIRHAAKNTAYLLETERPGVVRVLEKPMGSVVCEAIPRRKPHGVSRAEAAEKASGAASEASTLSTVSVPALESLPSATHVIYLDFDGEVVTDPDWYYGRTINAQPAHLGSSLITSAQITDIWRRVAEDYKPFNISVTTVLSRYTAAGPGKRMRCIITETDTAEPGAGGVGYVDSYDEAGTYFSATVPCWAFTESYYVPDDISGTISHEVGHTLGLSHDGRYASSSPSHEEYYEGHGSGATSWGPLMGSTYGRAVSQWSKGEYANASNHEDDLAIIARAANGFLGRTDDAPDAVPAIPLANLGTIQQTGIISTSSDTDLYFLATEGGNLTVEASPAAVAPNLDILLELRAEDGVTVLKSSNPTGLVKASITYAAPKGSYIIAVRNSGYGTASNGYTTYGSLGEYTLTGSFAALPDVAPMLGQQPVSQAVAPGTKVTFAITSVSNAAPAYQWMKDDVEMPGENKSTLVLTSAQVADQGVYRCRVSNLIGSVVSDPATLTINYKPVYLQQPAAQAVAAGGPATFSVQVNGTPTVTYQWQRNGVNIPQATAATLTLNDAQFADMGSYQCIASNAFGSATSSVATLTVRSKPVITIQPPANFMAPLNGSTTVGLTAQGTGTLSYQWYFGSTKITGQTKAVLSLSKITAAMAGAYHCEVKNLAGVTNSENCNIVIQDAPFITRGPAGTMVAKGKKTMLSVAAVGSPTLKYEWRRNGVKVAGAAASLAVVGSTDADYQVTVSNAKGAVTSAVAHVTVHEAPTIVMKPLAQTKAYGGAVTFGVVAGGTPPLAYQWKKNNVAIPGASARNLTLSGLAAADAASYSVQVSNDVGSVTTTAVKLTLQTAPQVASQPSSVNTDAYYPVSFKATATGNATLRYQWQRNGVDIPGATAAAYSIASAQTSNQGMYRVKVYNAVGTAYSAEAALNVTAVGAPAINAMTPRTGKAGHYVRVLGSNLKWTTGVSFRNASSAPVKAAFVIVSANELLVTVPAGAATSAITVTTRGGVATTSSSFLVTMTNDSNDLFANARVIPSAGGKLTGDNSKMTGEPGEPYHALEPGYAYPVSDLAPTYSAWFQWTPTVSGSYSISTGGSAFDTRVAIYQGASVSSLTVVGYNDDQNYDGGIYTSRAVVSATAGTTYYIVVDGFNYLYETSSGNRTYIQRGAYAVAVAKTVSSTVVASSVQDPWSLQGPVKLNLQGTGEITLGGSSEPTLAWLSSPAVKDSTTTRCHGTVSFAAPQGTQDMFGITGYAADGRPMFGLSWDAATGAMSVVDAEGNATTTGQTLISGERYDAEVWFDAQSRTWGAALNGTPVASNLAVPEGMNFADFAAQSLPSAKGPAGTLTVSAAEIVADGK